MVKENILVLLLTLEGKKLMFYYWIWYYPKVFSHMSLWLFFFFLMMRFLYILLLPAKVYL